jgi:hypothetical protein
MARTGVGRLESRSFLWRVGGWRSGVSANGDKPRRSRSYLLYVPTQLEKRILPADYYFWQFSSHRLTPQRLLVWFVRLPACSSFGVLSSRQGGQWESVSIWTQWVSSLCTAPQRDEWCGSDEFCYTDSKTKPKLCNIDLIIKIILHSHVLVAVT